MITKGIPGIAVESITGLIQSSASSSPLKSVFPAVILSLKVCIIDFLQVNAVLVDITFEQLRKFSLQEKAKEKGIER